MKTTLETQRGKRDIRKKGGKREARGKETDRRTVFAHAEKNRGFMKRINDIYVCKIRASYSEMQP